MTVQEAVDSAADHSEIIGRRYSFRGQTWIVQRLLIAYQGNNVYELDVSLQYPPVKGIELRERVSVFLAEAQQLP